tara:strand:+ start:364 stop:525 length:162 start_codon:yes stop_codon:yes gene_type:complete
MKELWSQGMSPSEVLKWAHYVLLVVVGSGKPHDREVRQVLMTELLMRVMVFPL